MGKTEQWFWESTPRYVMALIDQKNRIDKINQKNLAIYIASYVWGKDPDEFEENDYIRKPIPGVDVPIDPELINTLF